jgi:ABC-type uncharacterized transport system fused permease/ATPase subunit
MCTLSTEQQLCFEKYINGENLFITGPGGTGKSFLIKSIGSAFEYGCPTPKFIISSDEGTMY